MTASPGESSTHNHLVLLKGFATWERIEGLIWIKHSLLAVAAMLGGIVAWRILAGPFSIAGIQVHAPLNPEGVFGLLVVGLLAWKTRPGDGRSDDPASTFRAVALLALVGLYPATRVYFVSDDFILVRQAQTFSAGVFASAGGDGFFRPVGYVSLAMNAWIAGLNPVIWHTSALVLHAINAFLVAMLCRRLGAPAGGALLAGSLFALHGTHLEAAVWIAGRFDLLATLFTLGTLLLYGKHLWLALLCGLAALWSKESAYVLPFLVAIVARWERRSWTSAAPYAGLTLAAFLYRWVLLGGIGGYREASGEAAFYSLKAATTAKAVFVRLWTSLFFPINWSEDPSLLVGVLALLYIAALLWLAWRGGTTGVRWSLGGLMVSILPPLHLLGGAADLSGGRLLYLPSVWFCLMLGFAVAGLAKRELVAVSAAVLLFHFGVVQHDLRFWSQTSEQVRATCAGAEPPAAAPAMIDGVPALANGLEDCVAITHSLK